MQIKCLDKCIYDPNDVIFRHIIVQVHWKESALTAVSSLNKTFHPGLLSTCGNTLTLQATSRLHGNAFSHSLGRVEMWRGSIQYPVSTSRSSNRTCRSPASGSRTRHYAFTHA